MSDETVFWATESGMPPSDSDFRRAALRLFIDRNADVISVNKWEAAAGLGEGTLRRFLKGKTDSLNASTYAKLASAASRLLKRIVTVNEIYGENPPPSPTSNASPVGAISPLLPGEKMRDLAVTTLLNWRLDHSSSGQQGAFVLISEPVADLPPIEQVAEAKKPFRCTLLDNANAPGYAAGHEIVVDPGGGAVIGDLCIFTDKSRVLEGGAPSVAAILQGFDASDWIVTQNTVEGDQRLARKLYPQAWPVIAHYPRGMQGQ